MVLFFSNICFACSLADHKWKNDFRVDFQLLDPLVVIPELNLIFDKCSKKDVSGVLWVVESYNDAIWGFLSKCFLSKWPSKLSWTVVSKENFNLSNIPLSEIVIGSEKTELDFAFSTDANSDGTCHDVVILQQSLVKVVSRNPKNPFADQYRLKCWLEISYIGNILDLNILSISVFPYNGYEKAIYENSKYAEKLLNKGILKRFDTGD